MHKNLIKVLILWSKNKPNFLHGAIKTLLQRICRLMCNMSPQGHASTADRQLAIQSSWVSLSDFDQWKISSLILKVKPNNFLFTFVVSLQRVAHKQTEHLQIMGHLHSDLEGVNYLSANTKNEKSSECWSLSTDGGMWVERQISMTLEDKTLRNIYSLPTSKDAFLDLWRSNRTSVINNSTTKKLFLYMYILLSNVTTVLWHFSYSDSKMVSINQVRLFLILT